MFSVDTHVPLNKVGGCYRCTVNGLSVSLLYQGTLKHAHQMLVSITTDTSLFLYTLQAMSKQVQALTKVVGKKEEQLQALRHHQTHMTTTIQQLQGEVKKNGAAAAADKAAKTYAADLQTKVSLCPSLCALLFTAQQLASASVLCSPAHCTLCYSCNALAIVLTRKKGYYLWPVVGQCCNM